MPPARVCHGSLHGAETSFQLTLALQSQFCIKIKSNFILSILVYSATNSEISSIPYGQGRLL